MVGSSFIKKLPPVLRVSLHSKDEIQMCSGNIEHFTVVLFTRCLNVIYLSDMYLVSLKTDDTLDDVYCVTEKHSIL